MDRYRLIASIVVLLVYLLAMFPMQTITTVVIIAIAYFIITNLNGKQTADKSQTTRRKNALKEAKIYLAPYNDIWRNLKLSNKHCSLKLGSDGSSITARDAHNAARSFKVVKSRVHIRSDLWDMFCISFDYNTTFDGLVQLCRTFQVDIDLHDDSVKNYDTKVHEKNESKNSSINSALQPDSINADLPKEKLDVNNASEVELTALPGVSIVMAKKLIKKREEIGGFKSVDDVCLFLRLKPHMQNQLKMLICVNKMKGSTKIKRNNERSIDL